MSDQEKTKMKRRLGETAIGAICPIPHIPFTLQRFNHLTAAQP